MRFGANLLFEYGVDGHRQARPLCENRIVVLQARTPQEAFCKATQYGRQHEHSYHNADNQMVRIRFVGLVDLLDLDDDEPAEVYYSMFRTSRPDRYIKQESKLAAFRKDFRTIQSSWWAVPAFLVKSTRKVAKRSSRSKKR